MTQGLLSALGYRLVFQWIRVKFPKSKPRPGRDLVLGAPRVRDPSDSNSQGCSFPKRLLDECAGRRSRTPVHATAERVVHAAPNRWFDVLSVDLDRRRAQEPQPRRLVGIVHHDLPNRRIESERPDDVANQLRRPQMVRTAIEVENVNLRHRISPRNVRLHERGRVVDSVADHGHSSPRLEPLNESSLFRREHVRVNLFDPRCTSKMPGCSLVVAGDKARLDPEALEPADGIGGIGPQGIAEAQKPNQDTVDALKRRADAKFAQRCCIDRALTTPGELPVDDDRGYTRDPIVLRLVLSNVIRAHVEKADVAAFARQALHERNGVIATRASGYKDFNRSHLHRGILPLR